MAPTATTITGTKALARLEYLTAEQAAELLQCSAEHIRRQIRLGNVPGVVRTVGLIRIRTDALLGRTS